MLDPAAEVAGYRCEFHETLGSSNQYALDVAQRGGAGRLWVQAGAQSSGRGRSGRGWTSPPGNLYASLLLVDPAEPRCLPQLGFVAGLALVRAVRRLPGVPAHVQLKWPNDLVYAGAKVAGILAESTRIDGGRTACVVGFGVNCRSHPGGLSYETTDLARLSGLDQPPERLLRHLTATMLACLSLWDRGRNFPGVRDAWLAAALPKWSKLTVRCGSSMQQGLFDTIDVSGRLVLQTASGPMTVDAADVFLNRTGAAVEAAVR